MARSHLGRCSLLDLPQDALRLVAYHLVYNGHARRVLDPKFLDYASLYDDASRGTAAQWQRSARAVLNLGSTCRFMRSFMDGEDGVWDLLEHAMPACLFDSYDQVVHLHKHASVLFPPGATGQKRGLALFARTGCQVCPAGRRVRKVHVAVARRACKNCYALAHEAYMAELKAAGVIETRRKCQN